MTSIKMYLEIT